MQIGSTAGPSLSQLLSQMQARLASQTSFASSSSSTTSSTSSTSTTTGVSEDLSYFLNSLSDRLMSGLLGAQQVQGEGEHGGAPELSDMDSDGDGAISKTEMEAFDTSKSGSTDTTRADQMFSVMDSDSDGSVTATEKSAFDSEMAANRPRGGPPPAGDATANSSASSAFSSMESSTDFASLLKDLQSAIEAYSSDNLKSMASASASSLSVAA
ncbi:hypothetical protein [Asticcacaulis sp.]|uniref:hypothetical protein n=1 Tax=Asticcacaulis sp. TaxID=1872648 RepID=UPI002BC03723|nr:hypothetical protein [Asticcacaulis sp.]HTM80752.1 hypothetical protein [Asticcacaulis sp.]